jgi:hypothetical protein
MILKSDAPPVPSEYLDAVPAPSESSDAAPAPTHLHCTVNSRQKLVERTKRKVELFSSYYL